MRRIAALVLICALLLVALLPASFVKADMDYGMISVSISSNGVSSISLTVKGVYFIGENLKGFSDGILSIASDLNSVITVSHSEKGVLYSGHSVSIMRDRIEPAGGYICLNGKCYLGHFIISASDADAPSLKIINNVPLAHYLYGTVGSSMSNSFPIEALKAQAIACKSRTLANLLASGDERIISDMTPGLVYTGFNSGALNIIEAVDATLLEALFINASPLDAHYCISNGGETSLPGTSASDNSAYSINIDPYDFYNPNSRVERLSFSLGTAMDMPSSLYKMLTARSAAQLGKPVDTIAKVYSAELHSPRSKGSSRDMTRCTVKMRLSDSASGVSYDNISIDFPLSAIDTFINTNLTSYWGCYTDGGSRFTIYHARFGHGAGLSQRGAQQRALSGHSYKQILDFYYPNAELISITVSAPHDPEKTLPLPTGVYVTAVTTGNVNFRIMPNTDCRIITTLTKGTAVKVYSSSNGWALAVYNGTAGYISEKYLKYDTAVSTPAPASSSTPAASPSPSASSPIGYGIVTGENVNFRSGPSTSYPIITQLNKGTYLLLYSKSGNWYFASAPSVLADKGYISASYVELTSSPLQPSATPIPSSTPSLTPSPAITPVPTATAHTPVTELKLAAGITNSEVNFRTRPSVSNSVVIELLGKDANVNILGYYDDWYYILYKNRTGFVSKSYIDVTTQGTTGIPLVPATLTLIATNTTAEVNLRCAPNLDSAIIRRLPRSEQITVFLILDGWCLVKHDEEYGYVSRDYVRLT